MTKPVRLQLSRRKGFDLQALSIATNGLPARKVSRPTIFGNPIICTPHDCELKPCAGCPSPSRCCVKVFREYVTSGLEGRPSCTGSLVITLDAMDGYARRTEMVRRLPELKGKNLACFCSLDKPCHADVLLELANGEGA
jgi:hypothetical protein